VEPLPEPAPKPLPEPVIEPAPMPKPLPEPVVEPAPKPVAKPKPAPKAPVRRPPEPVAKREPAPKVEPETQPRPEAAAPATPPAAPPSAATSQRVDAVVRARYEDLLHSWLERHKRYPLIARRRNMEGGVVVELLLGRDGSLQSHKLIEGSGYEILDEAAMALVASAAPYPKMPEDYPGESFRYRALIRYELR
jgi:protein TonB